VAVAPLTHKKIVVVVAVVVVAVVQLTHKKIEWLL